jgi:NAD(P)H-dependent flavin oxidoreductase YrpB (nitropropane dioxygenase family)
LATSSAFYSHGTNSLPLHTRLTEKLGISHPILLAPMGTASGGTLAKAVTEAGGLGIIGFGYGNQERIGQPPTRRFSSQMQRQPLLTTPQHASIRNSGRPTILA